MTRNHLNFWIDFCGRIGAPIFAATLVTTLVSRTFEVVEAVLMTIGLVLMYLHHHVVYHRRSGADE
jgi:hypothetical protein